MRLNISPREDLLRLGSNYGGWVIPRDLIGSDSICYCVGIGEDITFDLELIRTFGCTVHAFDPTPPAQRYIDSQSGLDYRFIFHKLGVWSTDDVIRFYNPANPAFDNYSAINLSRTSDYIEVPVRSVLSIMTSLGHDRIDLLKIDIEGAEYEVLDSVLRAKLIIRVICVEFDQPYPANETIRMVWRLCKSGYALVNIERWNMTFVYEPQNGI